MVGAADEPGAVDWGRAPTTSPGAGCRVALAAGAPGLPDALLRAEREGRADERLLLVGRYDNAAQRCGFRRALDPPASRTPTPANRDHGPEAWRAHPRESLGVS